MTIIYEIITIDANENPWVVAHAATEEEAAAKAAELGGVYKAKQLIEIE